MSRNGSGTYTIPNTFSPGDVIESSDMNQNFSDIATEISNSVAADGQTAMTGPLKAPNGTVSAPAWTFGSDPDSGAYRIGANNIGFALGGVKIVDMSGSGVAVTGTFSATGAMTLGGAFTVTTGGVTVSAGGAAVTGNSTITGTLGVSGNFAINTDKFTVTASNGSTVIGGGLTVANAATLSHTLAVGSDFVINSDKFTVVGSSGNTAIAGTLSVTGAATVNNASGVTARNTAKVFVTFAGSDGSVVDGFGVSSVVKDSVGDWTVTFSSAFGSANYSPIVSFRDGTAAPIVRVRTQGTTSLTIKAANSAGTDVDPDAITLAIFDN